MKPIEVGKSWESVSRKAYWDRNVPLERWREAVSAGHRSYLPDAVCGMSVSEFIHFYGVNRFILDWPNLRQRLPEQAAKKAGVFDLVWSQLSGGGWNLKPFPDFHTMPKRRRDFLRSVARTPGKSIYELAKSMGMQYRRAHEHAADLIRTGKIRGSDVVENGRKKTKLYPSYTPS